MLDAVQQLNPLMQALLATCFTWAVTAAGASLVFLQRDTSQVAGFDAWICRRCDDCCQLLVAACLWWPKSSSLNPNVIRTT